MRRDVLFARRHQQPLRPGRSVIVPAFPVVDAEEPVSRRFDPERRDRIIGATIDCIAEDGVAGTSHRKVAARADVPLGSMTYHFTSMDDLLTEAFAAFAETMSQQYHSRLERARTTEEARAAVVELICGPSYATRRDITLMFEMYAFGNHHPPVAAIAAEWLHRSRQSLALHFTPATCSALDALVEGWPIHSAFENAPLDRSLVAAVVAAVVDGIDAMPPPSSSKPSKRPRPVQGSSPDSNAG